MDFDEDPKPSEERLREAREDTERVPEQFVVACPMCATMYEDGRKTGGFEEELEIVDVSELVAEALDARTQGGAGTETGTDASGAPTGAD
jgi:Fe-S oxidoreductase